MSIFIRGVDLPKEGEQIVLTPSGLVKYIESTLDVETGVLTQRTVYVVNAVEMVSTPHGRLIDADALKQDGWYLDKTVAYMGGMATHNMPLDNPNVPTVIDAED